MPQRLHDADVNIAFEAWYETRETVGIQRGASFSPIRTFAKNQLMLERMEPNHDQRYRGP